MQLPLSRQAGFALALALSAALGACETRRTGQPVRESAGGNIGAPQNGRYAVPAATGLDTATGVDTTQARPGGAAADSAGAANPATFTDAHLFSMFDDVNSTELSAAGLGVKKATSAAVKNFATRLIRDHRELLNEAHVASVRLGITPQATSDSTFIKAETQMLDTLRAAPSGPSFDRLFITQQIRAHQKSIAALHQAEQTARSASVRKLMNHALSVLESHLREAQHIQGELGTKSSS